MASYPFGDFDNLFPPGWCLEQQQQGMQNQQRENLRSQQQDMSRFYPSPFAGIPAYESHFVRPDAMFSGPGGFLGGAGGILGVLNDNARIAAALPPDAINIEERDGMILYGLRKGPFRFNIPFWPGKVLGLLIARFWRLFL